MKTTFIKKIACILLLISFISVNVAVLFSQNRMAEEPACVDVTYYNHNSMLADDFLYCLNPAGSRCGIQQLCEESIFYFSTCQSTRCKPASIE